MRQRGSRTGPSDKCFKITDKAGHIRTGWIFSGGLCYCLSAANDDKVSGIIERMLLEIPYASMPRNMIDTVTLDLDGVRTGSVDFQHRRGDNGKKFREAEMEERVRMKLIRTEEAVGHVLCHDMTQIIPGVYKGARFRKGHIVTEEDIPVLLSMGKENLYVWEMGAGQLHENDAAERLAALCGTEGMCRSEAREGKIELRAACDGCFLLDSERLRKVNSVEQVMIATRQGGSAVKRGDKLAGTRIIPLMIDEAQLKLAEEAAGGEALMRVQPFQLKTAAIVTTGSEVKKGLIQDRFTPIVREKLAAFGITTIAGEMPGDDMDEVAAAIQRMLDTGADIILCTGGMSVDPDDNTPGAIRKSGAEVVSYGTPVLPGAMFLTAYAADGRPVLGLPGCVMFAKETVFDILLPQIAAGVRLTRQNIAALGEGGLLSL